MRFVFILTFGLAINSLGQTLDKDCNCPPNKFASTKPETIFTLTSGRIALCGYVENKDNERLFSEFVLTVCGETNVIDFGDALTVCRITTSKDTLRVEQLKNLPTGDELKFVLTVWRIEKLYFRNGQVKRSTELNREIRKYNQLEIKNVLTDYERLNRKLTYDNMDLVYRLFMAAISGDKTAHKYLTDKTRFGTLDGALQEDYEELIAMLKSWD
jgi:hypothetical protein